MTHLKAINAYFCESRRQENARTDIKRGTVKKERAQLFLATRNGKVLELRHIINSNELKEFKRKHESVFKQETGRQKVLSQSVDRAGYCSSKAADMCCGGIWLENRTSFWKIRDFFVSFLSYRNYVTLF
jgi:hypothetical protein